MAERSERFEQFRFSLLVRADRDLFAGPDQTREEYLREVFGADQVFEHYKIQFHYKPHPVAEPGGAVLGRIGREVEMDENLPPTEGLLETTHATWKAVVVAIDPVDGPDGQKVAVKVDRRVGGPLALISALVDRINETNPSAPYTIEVNPLFDTQSFWSWANEHEGQINELWFTLVAPNGIFGLNNNVKTEMGVARAVTGADDVTVGLKTAQSLNVNVDPVVETVDYAASTGGKIKARANNGDSFSSTSRPKTTTIKSEKSDREPLIVRAAKRVAEILGR